MPHTPGPWHEGQGNGEGSIFAGEGQRMRMESRGSTLYPVATIVGGWEPSEDVANSKLVTAAPELLAACKAAYAMMSGDGENDLEPWDAAMVLLESAMAKAEGR